MAPSDSRPAWRWARRVLAPLVGLAIIAAVVSSIGLGLLWRALTGVGWSFVAALPLALAAIAIKLPRWQRLCRFLDAPLPHREAARAFGSSILVGMITPGRVGELTRAKALADRDYDTPTVVLATVTDRVLDGLVLILVASASLGALRRRLPDHPAAWIAVAVAVVAALVLTARHWASWWQDLIAALRRIGRPRAFLELIGWSLAMAGCYFGAVAVLAHGLGIEEPLRVLPEFAVATLVGLVPVTWNGLGTREAMLVALLDASAEQAASLGLLSIASFGVATLVVGGLARWFGRG